MERLLSYSQAYEHLEKALQRLPVKTTTYLVIGRRGYGKTLLLNQMKKIAEALNPDVFWAESNSGGDIFRLYPFNDILNQVTSRIMDRTLEEIVEGFRHEFMERKGPNIVVILGLERLDQQQRDLFVYLSQISVTSNFILFGTIDEEKELEQDLALPPLNNVEISTEIIRLKRPTNDDFAFFLKKSGYRIPDNFLSELGRLVNGSFEMFTYCLKYYEEQGIINHDKELQEASFRFFPIPPSIEVTYRRMISSLTPEEKSILQILALVGEDLPVDYLKDVTGFESAHLLEILDRLVEKNLVAIKNLNYRIDNQSLSDMIFEDMSSSSGQKNLQDFMSSKAYENLQFVTKLKLFSKVKDARKIEETVLQEWNKVRKSGFTNSVSSYFFLSLEKIISDQKAKNALKLMAADTLLQENNVSKAFEIYTSPEIMDSYPELSLLGKARVLWKKNAYDEAIEACKALIDDEYDNTTRGSACVIAANCYYSKNDFKKSMEYSILAEKISKENGLRDILADSLNAMGNNSVKEFDLDGAQALYSKSLEINRELRRFDKTLQCLNNMAIILSYRGKYDEAIEMLQDLISESYITGDLVSRAYALYNLSEIFYNSGNLEDCLKLLSSTERLVVNLNDSNLSYPFYRFLTILNLNIFKPGKAFKYAEMMEIEATRIGNEEWRDISIGLKGLVEVFTGARKIDELNALFSRDVSFSDDFSPMWYSIATMHFIAIGDLEMAKDRSEKSRKSAEKLGDHFGTAVSQICGVYVMLASGNIESVRKFISSRGNIIGSKVRYGDNTFAILSAIAKDKPAPDDLPPPQNIVELFIIEVYRAMLEKHFGKDLYERIINKYRQQI